MNDLLGLSDTSELPFQHPLTHEYSFWMFVNTEIENTMLSLSVGMMNYGRIMIILRLAIQDYICMVSSTTIAIGVVTSFTKSLTIAKY